MNQRWHQELLVKLRKWLPRQHTAWACLLMFILVACLRSVAIGATAASVPDKHLVDNALAQTKAEVPRPLSFAYCGNTFGPEAVRRITDLGYKFARRGEMPEARYGTLEIGSTFDPKRHHPLLIPTTGDAYPNWSLEHLKAYRPTQFGQYAASRSRRRPNSLA